MSEATVNNQMFLFKEFLLLIYFKLKCIMRVRRAPGFTYSKKYYLNNNKVI